MVGRTEFLLNSPSLAQNSVQERKGHINLRKCPGHRPGVPGGTNGGLPAGVPGTSCYLLYKNGQKRAFLPGHRPGVPGTPVHRGGFHKFHVIFSYVPFLLPISEFSLSKQYSRRARIQ